jgi:ferredoxin-NADP reductase/Na+-transporting NADH:ubiquinone oxidoreductase subunit NqrB
MQIALHVALFDVAFVYTAQVIFLVAMFTYVDRFLNSTTMYRVVLYALTGLAAISISFGFFGWVPYGGVEQFFSLAILCATCVVSNLLFARLLRVPANTESMYITAFILFFLLFPLSTVQDIMYLVLGGVIAMASKYLLAINAKHFFNPAALAAFALGFSPFGGAIWWVGTPALFIPTLIAGFLIVRKTRRWAVFNATILTSVVVVFLYGLIADGLESLDPATLLYTYQQHFLSWPIIFFASVMVTEPLTLPPRRREQIFYGIFAGAVSNWPFNIGPVYGTPEFSLLLANIYTAVVGMHRRLLLRLKEKRQIARETFEFAFEANHAFKFIPGQYLEWTLPHAKSDDRGIRRYFTIASSPTEPEVHLGVRIGEKKSTFKTTLQALEPGATMYAGQLSGDFVLPNDPKTKLVFIAGGIGITPFRSMVKWLVDTKSTRDIVLLYSAREEKDVAYRELFDGPGKEIGLKTVYMLSGNAVPKLEALTVSANIPDYAERTFYLSGPTAMVDSYKKLLTGMGVHRTKIVTDYFPGFA